MRVAYFDCFAGISGEMLLAALLDTGLSLDALRAVLSGLPDTGYTIEAQKITTQGVTGTQVVVLPSAPARSPYAIAGHGPNGSEPAPAYGRDLQGYANAIANSDLPNEVRRKAASVLELLEGTNKQPVDMGAVTAAMATIYALAMLGVESAIFSAVNMGGGYVPGQAGMPCPAPEVAEILRTASVPVYGSDTNKALVTLSGATLAATLAASFGPVPTMTMNAIGYAMTGMPSSPGLRVVLGDLQQARITPVHPREAGDAASVTRPRCEGEEIVSLIEANLDDTNPQYYDFIMERLLWQGALDVFLVPVHMRMNKQGAVLTVICKPQDVDALSEMIFEETSASGLRLSDVPMRMLEREIVQVDTRWGSVKVKVGHNAQGRVLNVKPDYEDVKRVALQANVPIDRVYEEARAAWNPSIHDGHQQPGRQRRPPLEAVS